MTPDEYKQAALRTENTPSFIRHARRDNETISARHHDHQLARIIHAILGMITELGELCDPVKRHLIYGKPLDIENMIEEMGDREWYSSGLMLDALNARLEDIWARNIAKLRARYPDKFTEERAINRDLAIEQAALAAPNDHMLAEIVALSPATRANDAVVIKKWREGYEALRGVQKQLEDEQRAHAALRARLVAFVGSLKP